MNLSFLERYSELNSLIHRLDPRTKLLGTLAFVAAVVTTPPARWEVFGLYFVLLGCLLVLSRVPPGYILKRSLVIVPFVLAIALFIPFFKEGEVAGSYHIWLWQVRITYSGLIVLGNVVVKAWLAVLSLILLSTTTRLHRLLQALGWLGVPRVMVTILTFMYRYLFVLVDEVTRMRRARASRNFGGKRFHQLKTTGNMIGTLFIRSYERGERVYVAMLARGFDGEVRTLTSPQFGRLDWYFGAAFGLSLIAITIFRYLWV